MIDVPKTPNPAAPLVPPTAPLNPLARWLMASGRVIVRGYALTIMLIIAWAGYASVAYLVQTVFFPVATPQRFTAWAASPNVRSLRSDSAVGVSAPALRAPIGHYHAVNTWFEPDRHNNCTLGGCHNPLPHSAHKEVRAFANLHATFMACEMCHERNGSGSDRVVWVGKEAGEIQGAPAMLNLMRELETNASQLSADPASRHPVIVGQLRELMNVLREDPLLQYLLVQIDTTDPASPVWRQAIAQLKEELPNHLRGEYGAKLMTRDAAERSRSEHNKMEDAARRFRSSGEKTPERQDLFRTIHDGVLTRPGDCLACHGEKPTRLDYDALGYSPARQAVLYGLSTARMMQQIRGGKPFHLPGLLDPRPTAAQESTTRLP